MTGKRGGYTEVEKEIFENCGYHNYSEFIEDFDNLLIKEYGVEHGISYTRKPIPCKSYKYRNPIDNHIFSFDFTNGNERTSVVKDFIRESGQMIVDCNGREMFDIWQCTSDFEECILLS